MSSYFSSGLWASLMLLFLLPVLNLISKIIQLIIQWICLSSSDHYTPVQMNTSACLSDTSLLMLTLLFKINTARIKVLIISPWVLTPYYLLNKDGLHHFSCPSGSWFRYHFHLWELPFQLYWSLVDFSPVWYLKAFLTIHKFWTQPNS